VRRQVRCQAPDLSRADAPWGERRLRSFGHSPDRDMAGAWHRTWPEWPLRCG
jgi:hypothetical protein